MRGSNTIKKDYQEQQIVKYCELVNAVNLSSV